MIRKECTKREGVNVPSTSNKTKVEGFLRSVQFDIAGIAGASFITSSILPKTTNFHYDDLLLNLLYEFVNILLVKKKRYELIIELAFNLTSSNSSLESERITRAPPAPIEHSSN